ncbi:unnamed protein product [Aphanomyces euteiches]
MNIIAITTAIFAAALSTVDKHGRLNDPMPTFIAPLDDNTNTMIHHKPTPKPSTVHSQGDTGGECGITRADGTPQPLPGDGNVKWIHGNEGFVASHEGPCEIWCDDTRVYVNDNCARNVPNGIMPIDVSKCQGASRLFFLWLAMHTHEWQVYKNCVRLQGGGGNRPPSNDQPTMVPSPPSPPSSGNVHAWEQCGGEGYKGPTGCTQGCIASGSIDGTVNVWLNCSMPPYMNKFTIHVSS